MILSNICLCRFPFRIPPELILIVTDFLKDDVEALSACSLVCRDWLDIVRPGLFRKIYFKADASDFDAKLSSFLQFFGSAHYIARYVSPSLSRRETARDVILDQDVLPRPTLNSPYLFFLASTNCRSPELTGVQQKHTKCQR